MEIYSVQLFLLIGVAVVSYYATRKDDQEDFERTEKRRKNELKKLVEGQEQRTIETEYDEEKFWFVLEKIQERAKFSYKNSIGLFKDSFLRLSPEELIQLDNLVFRLIKENVTKDIWAVATVIFKDNNPNNAIVLMNLFMLRGKVFFNNACLNPNLIIGKEFNSLEDTTFNDVIGEIYFERFYKFIPYISEDLDLSKAPGEAWELKDLPSRFPEIWAAFA